MIHSVTLEIAHSNAVGFWTGFEVINREWSSGAGDDEPYRKQRDNPTAPL